jgi:chemotaxis signal transduction protein
MHTPYLTFHFQGAWYAVEASWVREILRLPALTPVSEAPHYIVAIVNYRGHILQVMELGLRLGQFPWSYQIRDHVIVLEQESRPLGMIANEVHAVHEIALETPETRTAFAEPPERGSRSIRYLAKLGTTAIMIIDHDRLLNTAAEPRADVKQAALTVPDVR